MAPGNGFSSLLQAELDAAWPPRAAIAARTPPHLRVVSAESQAPPRCARDPKTPIFWVHLSGLLRTFLVNAKPLRRFLDASATCWYVVLLAPDTLESAGKSWWQDRAGYAARFTANNTPSVLEQARAASALIGESAHGAIAHAVVHRAYEEPARAGERSVSADNSILQAYAAGAALGRVVQLRRRLTRSPAPRRLSTTFHSPTLTSRGLPPTFRDLPSGASPPPPRARRD